MQNDKSQNKRQAYSDAENDQFFWIWFRYTLLGAFGTNFFIAGAFPFVGLVGIVGYYVTALYRHFRGKEVE